MTAQVQTEFQIEVQDEIDERLDQALRLDAESLERFEAGCLEEAEHCCRRALALFEELDGPGHPDAANLLQRLSAVLAAQCRYLESEECAARAVAIMDRVAQAATGPEISLVHIEALRQWGSVLRQLARYDAAAPVLQRAMMLAERHPDRALLVGVLNELGVLSKYTSQFTKGVRFYRRALNLARDLFGENHSNVAAIYHNMGGLEHARGAYRIGEKPARLAWQIRCRLLGDDHPATMADQCAWAGLLDGLGRFVESRAVYERALVVFERCYGPDHFEIAATLHNLAAVDAAEDDYESAVRHATRALAIKLRLFGEEHPEYVGTAKLLALILRRRLREPLTTGAIALEER